MSKLVEYWDTPPDEPVVDLFYWVEWGSLTWGLSETPYVCVGLESMVEFHVDVEESQIVSENCPNCGSPQIDRYTGGRVATYYPHRGELLEWDTTAIVQDTTRTGLIARGVEEKYFTELVTTAEYEIDNEPLPQLFFFQSTYSVPATFTQVFSRGCQVCGAPIKSCPVCSRIEVKCENCGQSHNFKNFVRKGSEEDYALPNLIGWNGDDFVGCNGSHLLTGELVEKLLLERTFPFVFGPTKSEGKGVSNELSALITRKSRSWSYLQELTQRTNAMIDQMFRDEGLG